MTTLIFKNRKGDNMTFHNQVRQIIEVSFKSGNIEVPNTIDGISINANSKRAIGALVKLLMTTDFSSDDTKAYLTGERNSWHDVSKGCAENINTSRTKVRNDLLKIKYTLGEDGIADILRNKDKDIARTTEKLEDLIEKQGNDNLIKGFGINLSKSLGTDDGLSEDEYIQLINMASVYSKKKISEAESAITVKMVGYMRHLEKNRMTLDEIDNKRYEELKSLLVGK